MVDELLERIATGPVEQELELLRVYADQRIECGDPHGELIVVATARLARDTPELARREATLIAEREAAILATLAHPTAITFTWRRGFLDTVAFTHRGDAPLERSLAALATEPAARLLRRISIDSVRFLGPVFVELARLAPQFPRLVEFSIVEGLNLGQPIRDVSPLYAAYPRLEVLELDGDDLELGPLNLPALRRLMATRLRGEDARKIVAAQLPALADLELWFWRRVDNVAATFGPLLHRELPTLEALSLALPTNEAMQWLVRELPTCPLARNLKRLAFRHSTLDELGLRSLIDDAPRLDRLERLELPARPLSAGLQRQLTRVYGRRLVLV